ncbi:hypothetical protein MnTg02_03232 [bacterium MnTg02]|nr:hypothetical protein MnTg02_03232 [bacterium MnTg02]
MNALILQAVANGVLIGGRWLAAGDVHGVAGRTKGRNETFESFIQIFGEFHQRQPIVETGV